MSAGGIECGGVINVSVGEPLSADGYLRLFGYHVANEKRQSIDELRNLAENVTAE